MWRIESSLDDAGAPYDRRAAVYDGLVRSRIYNRIAWGSSPNDYARFAAAAITSSIGPLLEVAAGTAAATADLHVRSQRPTMLVDLSHSMLERAARRLAAAAHRDEVPGHIRLLQADLFQLPLPPRGYTTIIGLGLTHLFDEPSQLIGALREQLAPGGQLYLTGLVSESRRGRRYLQALHRAGEVGAPMTADELRVALDGPETFETRGCMAYAVLADGPRPPNGAVTAATRRRYHNDVVAITASSISSRSSGPALGPSGVWGR